MLVLDVIFVVDPVGVCRVTRITRTLDEALALAHRRGFVAGLRQAETLVRVRQRRDPVRLLGAADEIARLAEYEARRA